MSNMIMSILSCSKKKYGYPSFTPYIYLSTDTSVSGTYTKVNINGYNFQPNNKTFVLFGSLVCSVVFYSSSTISFVVPRNISPGIYLVKAVNIYNNNFNPRIHNISSDGNYVYSNEVAFTVV